MADLLQQARRQIHHRLSELKPLVEEYHRLQAAAAALGGGRPSRTRTPKTSGPTSKGSARPPASAPAPRRRRARAPSGARAAQALAALREQPGIRASEVAKRIGASRTYVHALLVRLEREGKALRDGSAWHAKDR